LFPQESGYTAFSSAEQAKRHAEGQYDDGGKSDADYEQNKWCDGVDFTQEGVSWGSNVADGGGVILRSGNERAGTECQIMDVVPLCWREIEFFPRSSEQGRRVDLSQTSISPLCS
jgi:hypothetical protein